MQSAFADQLPLSSSEIKGTSERISQSEIQLRLLRSQPRIDRMLLLTKLAYPEPLSIEDPEIAAP